MSTGWQLDDPDEAAPLGLADLMVEAMEHEEGARPTTGVVSGAASGTEDAVDQAVGDVGDGGDGGDEHEWRYPTLQEWVHEWLVPTLERDRNKTSVAWCAWWWKHPEAVAVLGALWHQWEASQDQPWTGMSSYLTHYHYPLLQQLTRPDGPFGPCWTESRSTRTSVHREHDQHFGPPEVAGVVDVDVATALGAAADWMPPPTS